MDKWAIIADDQTGAGDSGIHFARGGMPVALVLDYDRVERSLADFSRISITTNSRFLAAHEAAKRVEKVVCDCQEAGFRRFFKKIDSTMRGNAGGEIAAALKATASRAALICPAIPKLGRSCVDGELLVEEKPLAQSPMGQDPFHPLTSSKIAELLAYQSRLLSCHLALSDLRGDKTALLQRIEDCLEKGCQQFIADAQTPADLSILAELLLSKTDLLPVGAAGLAEAIAEQLGGAENAKLPAEPCGRMLAVVGSLTRISRAQADCASRAGVMQVLEFNIAAALADFPAESRRLLGEIEQGAGGHLLLQTTLPPAQLEEALADGEQVARLLGRMTEQICLSINCPIVFAAGGSTSAGIAEALEIHLVQLQREVFPGVVLGRCDTGDLGVRWFVTKAGGFGDENTLKNLAESFTLNTKSKAS